MLGCWSFCTSGIFAEIVFLNGLKNSELLDNNMKRFHVFGHFQLFFFQLLNLALILHLQLHYRCASLIALFKSLALRH